MANLSRIGGRDLSSKYITCYMTLDKQFTISGSLSFINITERLKIHAFNYYHLEISAFELTSPFSKYLKELFILCNVYHSLSSIVPEVSLNIILKCPQQSHLKRVIVFTSYNLKKKKDYLNVTWLFLAKF